MKVNLRNAVGVYDGRQVPYTELEVLGTRHTLSVRKYPKNVLVQMWENYDKRNTKVTLKIPHNKFDFYVHVSNILGNFAVEIPYETVMDMERRWIEFNQINNF